MMSNEMAGEPYDELERALSARQEPRGELLESLSDLQGEALVNFRQFWARLGSEDRALLLGRLSTAAADNLILDFSVIYAHALDDHDAVVREMALQLAAEEAPLTLLDAYLAAASDDPDPHVRLAALEALGSYTLAAQTDDWPSGVQERLESALVRQLHQASSDASSRRAALLSLAYLTTPRSQAEIRQAYLQPDLRDAAIEAMGRNCQELWIPDVVDALEDDDPELRALAAEAAGELEDERLVPALVARLADRDEDVRMAAIEALGLIGGADARAELAELMHSRDRSMRDAARDAMEALLDETDPMRDLPLN